MRTPLLIMLAILIATQAGFVIGATAEKDGLVTICVFLTSALVMVVYAYVLISGLTSYSRELKDRTGYLIFMAPVRPISIVASKLVFTVLAAVIVAVLFGGCAVLDYMYLFKLLGFTRTDWAELSISFRLMFADAGVTLTQVALMGVYMVLSVLIELITTLSTAYLAMTVSATVMNNRRGFWRGFVSFSLFVALVLLTGFAGNKLFTPEIVEDVDALIRLLGTATLFSAAVSCLFAFASAALLNRRVSL